ncbi:hypothetical protein [Cellvibrio japonicus]|uniref:hypothetical protein n=1 Tax=Cellvibrio japonicus TaxID=155077 RepID=UPI0005A150FD|nr:hypothetical protein [Cellvibrio japonicus]QEI10779.1 hypothetical protein FY117_00085 [Cellvibrio japonicus]QEI14355.1 hypothetical protein FY116_00085 [Cellvibrio japonicus]QEI17933.1 hypothetical protein FY115_00085 [Cellvibrio japonicus]
MKINKSVICFTIFIQIFLVGCDYKNDISHDVNHENDIKNFKSMFSFSLDKEGYILNVLSGLRYYDHVSQEKLNILNDVWNKVNFIDNKWNLEILENIPIRILIAEILYSKGGDKNIQYKEFIISNIYSSNQGYRAFSALSLGFIGNEEDVDLLVNVLLNDKELPASQAGFGLLAMNNKYALDKFKSALLLLETRKDDGSKHIYNILKNHFDKVHIKGK